MLTKRIIPCLDVRDGRVVKGIQFKGLRDAGDPVELARAYQDQGADELVILDISATPEGRSNQTDTVRKVREQLSIPLTVGGGVRSAEDVNRLLHAGADKVGVNTAAVRNPEVVKVMATRFGSQCTVVAVDAYGTGPGKWELVVTSGSEKISLDAIQWIKTVHDLGAGEILLTSLDRDGTKSGYDLELLRAASQAVNIPIIASGGAASPQHLVDAIEAGADAVLAASIFHYKEHSVGTVKTFMAQAGIEVRR